MGGGVLIQVDRRDGDLSDAPPGSRTAQQLIQLVLESLAGHGEECGHELGGYTAQHGLAVPEPEPRREGDGAPCDGIAESRFAEAEGNPRWPLCRRDVKGGS